MVVTSNTKNKEKTKTLNKVIEQEAFSEGFTLLKNFCKKSTDNPKIISDFVTEFASENITKNIHRTLGENNIKTIKKFRELGFDPLELMQLLTCSKGIYHFWRKEKSLLSDMISALRTEFTAMELSSESELSRVEVDGFKFVKIESAKFYLSTSSGGKKRKFTDISSKLEDEVVDDKDYDSPFSNDKYYITNIRKLFLNFLTENNNKIPFVKYNANIYLSSNMNNFFVKGKDVITVYGGQERFRKDYLGWAVDYNFRIFLWQFYKNLEKFHKNNSEIFKIYIGLNNKKLSLENLNDDDYVLISTIDKREVGFRKVLLGYLWKGESIDNLRNFFINRIKEDFEVYLTNILESDYNLDNVYKKEVPLSILSDSQIINSVKKKTIAFRSIDLHILKIIKDNCHDPKQFSRLMNLIEENL